MRRQEAGKVWRNPPVDHFSGSFCVFLKKKKFVKQKRLTDMQESCMIAKVITDGEICRADFFI